MRGLWTLPALALVATLLAACCCPSPCCPPRCCPRPCPPPCGSAPATQPAAAKVVAPAPASGGLLGDTSAFVPSERAAGTWVWTRPDVDLRSYDDLLIEEIRLQPASGSAFAALPEADRAAAAKALRDALVRTVAPYYDVVDAPGAHTLKLRVALTSVPAADGSGAASLECELLDGKSEQRQVAAIGALTENELAAPATGEALTPAERSHRAWAARLLRYLDTHVRH
jgi:hypothetical protein